jgi:hypothetical protein
MTFFHSIHVIKQIGAFPAIEEADRIDFKFKKPGFTKLLIFDLDETLIHSLRSEDEEDTEFPYLYDEDERMDRSQLNWVDITDPESQER